MIEMHPDPRKAAVDPLQAINLDEFKKLINQLRIISETLNKTIV
jgi:3-deoxy-7-phosphoheptulonate synthase